MPTNRKNKKDAGLTHRHIPCLKMVKIRYMEPVAVECFTKRNSYLYLQDAVQAGGYLTAADDVVQAFHLPKYQHVVAEFSSDTPSSFRTDHNGMSMATKKMPDEAATVMESEPEQDVKMAVIDTSSSSAQLNNDLPLTMRQLASVANQQPLLSTARSSAKGASLDGSTPGCGTTPSRTRTTPVDVSYWDGATRRAKSTTKSPSSTRKHVREENGTSSQEAAPKRRKEDEAPLTSTPARVLRPRAPTTATQIRK